MQLAKRLPTLHALRGLHALHINCVRDFASCESVVQNERGETLLNPLRAIGEPLLNHQRALVNHWWTFPETFTDSIITQ